MIMNSQTASSSSRLTIELTDESNPFFIYTFDCSEQDFHMLKTQMYLMIDFNAFPGHLI
jgi:spindle assembly abnormal protein 6